jgi:DNA-binding transcriptional LysR family regulator
METKALLAFQTVAATGSFSKAAVQLGYTQSAISMQLKKLAAELNVTLFEYRHHRMALTAAGQALLPLAQQVLTDLGALQQWQATTPGILRVAAPETLLIQQVVAQLATFQAADAQRQIQLQSATCLHNEQAVLRREVDVAFMLWPGVPDPALVDVDLGLQDMVLVSNRPGQTLADLLAQPDLHFVINEPECSYRRQFETAMWLEHQRQFPVTELPSVAAIVAAVAQGLGFSYLPQFVVQQALAQGQLFPVTQQVANIIHAHLVYLKQANPLIQAFVAQVQATWPIKKHADHQRVSK